MRAAAVTEQIGRSTLLALACVQALARPKAWFALAAAESRRQIVDALPLTLLLSALGGMLIALQTGYQFAGNLPFWVVGSIVASSVVTEVAPLFVGLAMVGMIGTRMAAELGAMKITEQIDALEVIGRDPVEHLVLPRILGGMLAGPVLTAFALVASMLAGWIGAVWATHATTGDFWFGVRYYMRDFPMFFALIKGFAFGVAIPFIGCYAGLQASGGSVGVGRTLKSSVVAMLCAIVILDTLLVPLLKVVG
jgi:phospholipid/cholesterol/gamma-HCH transport system permease protein